jgi:predicted Zn-ribbon and HTH transcriptional regulator
MSINQVKSRGGFESAMHSVWPNFCAESHPKASDEYLKAPEQCAWIGWQEAWKRIDAMAWCPQCKSLQNHHGDPDSIHLHLCDACNGVVEY